MVIRNWAALVNQMWNACHIHCVCVGKRNSFFFLSFIACCGKINKKHAFFSRISKHMNTQISNTHIYYPFVRLECTWKCEKQQNICETRIALFFFSFHSLVESMQKHLPNNTTKVYPTNDSKHLIFVKSKEISMRIFPRCYNRRSCQLLYKLYHINFFFLLFSPDFPLLFD